MTPVDLVRIDGILTSVPHRLAPLLIAAGGRQRTSRTAQVQAQLSALIAFHPAWKPAHAA